MRSFCLLVALVAAAAAQQREIGILGGGGIPTYLRVEDTPAPVTAGFSSGPAAGVLVGHDMYPRVSGEIRYLFEMCDPRLSSSGVRAGFGGQTHALHYDVVLHARPRSERVRPYVAAGGGIKVYRGTGGEVAYRPLMEYAYLTRTHETKPMFTWGGGVKFRLGGRLLARVDIRDQVTRFPAKVIAPAPETSVSGWLHNLVPTVGLGWLF